MAKRHPNPRLAKIHRSYTVEEVAKLYGYHKNTVRNWIKNGLATIDKRHPMLIQGHVLEEFIRKRRTKNKQTCKPGQLYCVCCREPKFPADGLTECTPTTKTTGNLKAICPDCNSIMNQCVSLARIDEFREIWASHSRKHCDT